MRLASIRTTCVDILVNSRDGVDSYEWRNPRDLSGLGKFEVANIEFDGAYGATVLRWRLGITL
jgi:hypothetical protein